jgi:hypothetical protein
MYFIEGMGSPFLEYSLCSAAASLAQSQGLHRQVPLHHGLTEGQVAHQAWIFWAIYVHEKHATMRYDRPSVGHLRYRGRNIRNSC